MAENSAMSGNSDKLKFTFSKTSKKEKKTSKDENPHVEYVEAIEGNVIQSSVPVESSEVVELVIPLPKKKPQTLPPGTSSKVKDVSSIQSGAVDELEAMAVRELVQDAKNVHDTTHPALIVPVPIPLRLPSDEGEEESSLDHYESVPIEQFGLAMLKGMGWKPNDKKEKTGDEGTSLLDVPIVRPKGMGLGAEKPNISHIVDIKCKEDLTLKIGSYVQIVMGSNNGCYGEVQGIDEDTARVIVKKTLGGDVVSVNQVAVVVVTQSDYAKNSKVLNKKRYELYLDDQHTSDIGNTTDDRVLIRKDEPQVCIDDENRNLELERHAEELDSLKAENSTFLKMKGAKEDEHANSTDGVDTDSIPETVPEDVILDCFDVLLEGKEPVSSSLGEYTESVMTPESNDFIDLGRFDQSGASSSSSKLAQMLAAECEETTVKPKSEDDTSFEPIKMRGVKRAQDQQSADSSDSPETSVNIKRTAKRKHTDPNIDAKVSIRSNQAECSTSSNEPSRLAEDIIQNMLNVSPPVEDCLNSSIGSDIIIISSAESVMQLSERITVASSGSDCQVTYLKDPNAPNDIYYISSDPVEKGDEDVVDPNAEEGTALPEMQCMDLEREHEEVEFVKEVEEADLEKEDEKEDLEKEDEKEDLEREDEEKDLGIEDKEEDLGRKHEEEDFEREDEEEDFEREDEEEDFEREDEEEDFEREDEEEDFEREDEEVDLEREREEVIVSSEEDYYPWHDHSMIRNDISLRGWVKWKSFKPYCFSYTAASSTSSSDEDTGPSVSTLYTKRLRSVVGAVMGRPVRHAWMVPGIIVICMCRSCVGGRLFGEEFLVLHTDNMEGLCTVRDQAGRVFKDVSQDCFVSVIPLLRNKEVLVLHGRYKGKLAKVEYASEDDGVAVIQLQRSRKLHSVFFGNICEYAGFRH